jgi:hypothetical protein
MRSNCHRARPISRSPRSRSRCSSTCKGATTAAALNGAPRAICGSRITRYPRTHHPQRGRSRHRPLRRQHAASLGKPAQPRLRYGLPRLATDSAQSSRTAARLRSRLGARAAYQRRRRSEYGGVGRAALAWTALAMEVIPTLPTPLSKHNDAHQPTPSISALHSVPNGL